MSTLDNTIKEIRRAMMDSPDKEYFELSKTTLNYLLTYLQKYRTIEEEMKKRVGKGEKPTPNNVIAIIQGLED